MSRFSTPADIEECRRLHREFGTTYYFSTLRFPREFRWRVHALYGFVRVPDEWVDNPGPLTTTEIADKIEQYRQELKRGIEGVRPSQAVLRAFCDAISDSQLPVSECDLFLDAMVADLDKKRYQTYTELQSYMRGSASAVGVMMCHMMGVNMTLELEHQACSLGDAMQLTNFLRDVGEDLDRGRIYLPLEDLKMFGLTEDDILSRSVTEPFRELMRFEIARARMLYTRSDEGIQQLPGEMRKAVTLARMLYAKILDEIEANDFDVFKKRARTGHLTKVIVAAQVAMAR
ncbi:MAG TPA: phytoene/squalene synthase family protein [Fimbriimonas sp.]|nr:phytoene/squalene synthase family protein [Fimbriimonas sp.]